jgi:hypothetical protein
MNNMVTQARTGITADDMDAIDDLGGEFPQGPTGIDENFEFDSSDVDESNLDTSGVLDQEGWYHFEVTKVDLILGLIDENGKENTPKIKVTCKSLNNVRGQSPPGSVLWHDIYVGAKGGGPAKQGSIDAMFRFGVGVGLMKWTKKQNADGTEKAVLVLASNGSVKVPPAVWKTIVGAQFVAQVQKEKPAEGSTHKAGFKIPMGKAYRPDHPDVSHVQKNVEALEAIGIKVSTTAPTTTEQKAKAAYKTAEATGGPSSSAGKVEAPAQTKQVQAAAAAGGDSFSMDDL